MQPNNTSREVLLALRERVLAAKGADTKLWAAILATVLGTPEAVAAFVGQAPADRMHLNSDAAIALAEQVLPPSKSFAAGSPSSSGWKFTFYRGMTPTNEPYGYWQVNLRQHASDGHDADGRTLALAILAALLAALAGGPTHG